MVGPRTGDGHGDLLATLVIRLECLDDLLEILAGDLVALGNQIATALRLAYVVNGRVAWPASFYAALVRRSGIVEYIELSDSTWDRAVITWKKKFGMLLPSKSPCPLNSRTLPFGNVMLIAFSS